MTSVTKGGGWRTGLGVALFGCFSAWGWSGVYAGEPPHARPEARPTAGPETPAQVEAPVARAPAPHVGSHGSTLLVDAYGVLLVERDPGVVIRADSERGSAVAMLELSPGVAQIVHDGAGNVFASDRGADRVVRLDPGDERGEGLAVLASAGVREPYGLALTPDGAVLLVTSVADHSLVALSAQTLERLWSLKLAAEPRPVAVSPDGSIAAVGFLTSGSVAIVELAPPDHPVVWHSLAPADHVDIEITEEFRGKYGQWREVETRLLEPRSRFRVPVGTGRRYARNVRSLVFTAKGLLVGHQIAIPQLERIPSKDRRDAYGGGDREVKPIEHQVTLIERPGQIDARRTTTGGPELIRGIAYDAMQGAVYLAGFADDWIVTHDGQADVRTPAGPQELARCGIDGLVLAGEILWAHCGLSRTLIAVPRGGSPRRVGPELVASSRSELVLRGEEVFHRSSATVSASGLWCAACHPEGRNDHLSWRLGPEILQTPILAGRVRGTAPYKWDGADANLRSSFHHTIERLGGRPEDIPREDLVALAAYIESLPPPPTPSVEDPEAVARGRAVFEAEGCDACHSGPALTDGAQHKFATRLAQVDTPSLVGLAHSAPYFHDGSAQDLWALVTDKGNVHDMADTSALSEPQRRDLVAYLEGL